MKRLVIVCGACGVGKSAALRSMREALGGRVGEMAMLEADQFYMMIDPHWELPPDRVDRYFEVSGWLTCQTARELFRLGFEWVAVANNGFWDEALVREFAAPFLSEGIAVHHVTLDPGLDVASERSAAREAEKGDSVDLDEIRKWRAQELSRVREHSASWSHFIDNSSLTPAETALAIFEAVEARHGVLS